MSVVTKACQWCKTDLRLRFSRSDDGLVRVVCVCGRRGASELDQDTAVTGWNEGRAA